MTNIDSICVRVCEKVNFYFTILWLFLVCVRSWEIGTGTFDCIHIFPFCPLLYANCFAIMCLLLFTLPHIISPSSRVLSCMQFLAMSFALLDMSFCPLSPLHALQFLDMLTRSLSLSLGCIIMSGYHLVLTLHCMHGNLLI